MKKNNRIGKPIVVQSAQKVQAGVLEDVMSIIKGLFSTLCKGIDKVLEGSGYKPEGKAAPVKATKEHGPGYKRQYKTTKHEAGSGDVVTVEVVKTNPDGSGDNVDVKISCEGHKTFEKKNVPEKKVQKYIEDYMDSELGASYEGEVADTSEDDENVDASSKVCRVTLQRVTCGTEDTINLMKIQANYPIQLAMEDVQQVVEDDNFVDGLGQEPQSFEITEVPSEDNPDELEYNVDEIGNEEVDPSMSYEELLKAAAKFSFDIQCIGWGAKGPDMDNLRSRLFNFKWAAESAIDLFANLMVSETHVVPHLGKLPTGGTGGVDMSQGFDYQEGLTVLDKSIDKFIQTLEEHYINLSHEIQKRVDDLIFELKNGNSANIKRAMM